MNPDPHHCIFFNRFKKKVQERFFNINSLFVLLRQNFIYGLKTAYAPENSKKNNYI